MNSGKILIVDDDQDVLDIVGIILKGEQYSVDLLSEGHKIFEHIVDFSPDLIILDVMLGTTDGRTLCNKIKSDDQLNHIPVMMISASHDMEQICKEKCSPDDFLEKPFEVDTLVSKVQALITH